MQRPPQHDDSTVEGRLGSSAGAAKRGAEQKRCKLRHRNSDHTNALPPLTSTHSLRAPRVSCHSRCQSATSGSKTSVTESSSIHARASRSRCNPDITPLAACHLRTSVGQLATRGARADPGRLDDRAVGAGQSPPAQGFLTRFEVAFFLHPPECDVDGSRLRRPLARSTICSPKSSPIS